MTLVYKMLADGGFVVGDTETRLTGYAYPTSTNATLARKSPDRAATDIMSRQFPTTMHDRSDYDARNWVRLS